MAVRLAQLSAPVQGRSEWEVFYAYPSISAPAFFKALAGVCEEQSHAPPSASAADAYEALLELSRAAQVLSLLQSKLLLPLSTTGRQMMLFWPAACCNMCYRPDAHLILQQACSARKV